MAKYLILIISLLIPTISEAEDKIYLINGSVLVGKIVSMNEEQVVFKMLDHEYHYQKAEIKKIRSEADGPESPGNQTDDNRFWGLGLCAGLTGGIGLQNALRFWNFQWDVSFLPTGQSYYYAGTQLKYYFLQRHNKKMLAYIGASSDHHAAHYSQEYCGGGVGFSWSTKYAMFTVSGGVSNQYFLPLDFNFSVTHFF